MPTASLAEVQNNPTDTAGGTASLDDVQSVTPTPGVARVSDVVQPNTASISDIAQPNTASISDIASVTPPTVPAASAQATGEIRSAPQPSVWERISKVFTEGIPRYSTRTGNDSRYGETQLVTPDAALTPSEQQRHPIVTGAGEFAGGLTSPASVGLIAGTGGLGELPGAAAMIPRLMSAGFGVQAITSAAKQYPEIRAAFARGDTSEAERLMTHAVLDLGAAALAARHATTGKAAVSGKTEPTIAEDVPVHPASPIGELLHESAPDVRIVDSSATKAHLESQDTIWPADLGHEATPEAIAALKAKHGIADLHDIVGDASASVRGPSDIAEFRNPTARLVNDEHVPVVAKNEVLSQAIQTAINNSDELAKLGLDPSAIKSVGDAEAMLQKAADHIRTNLDPRASSTITFDAQKQLAEELGMSVEDLLSRRSGEAWNAEHAIAARGLLDASGRNVVKVALESKDNTALADALAQHQSVLDAVKGVGAEAGRALGSFRVQPPETQISNALRELSPDALDEARTLLGKIDPNNPRQLNQWLEQVKPATTADKVFELYRNSLLSGPATVIKKAASEVTMMALEATKKVVAAGLSKLQGGDDHFASESYWYSKGVINAMSHAKAVLTGEFDLADMPDFEKTGQRAIKGTVGDIVRFPSTVLSRQTNLMYVLNYFGELNAQAARAALQEGLSGDELAARQEYLVAHPAGDMTNAAHDLALRNTFQAELGKFAKAAQGTIRKDPTGALRYLLPFWKTPINLVKESANYSPYGLFKGIAKGDVNAQAAGLVGSGLAAGVAYLALNGFITGGGPVAPAKRETLEATAWQPYSIKLGDRYISYRRLEPVGLAFALVSDAVHSMKAGDPEVVSQSKADTAVAHITRNLADVAFLPTLSNLAEAITNPGARAQGFIRNEVASIVPAMMKDVAQAADPTIRKPTSIPQAIEARVPGLTSRVPAVIDITGQPVKRPASSVGGANPFPTTTAKNDPVISEIARLGISTPTPPSKVKLAGKQIQLSEKERQKVAEAEGQDFFQRATKLISQPSWQRKTDDAKRKMLTDTRKQVDEQRSVRVSRMRRDAKDELARSSL
jgi:hypothetical protein